VHIQSAIPCSVRHQVLPVGGIKEKLIAAKSADITTVFLPDGNRPGMSCAAVLGNLPPPPPVYKPAPLLPQTTRSCRPLSRRALTCTL
jgi:hypothetical protein